MARLRNPNLDILIFAAEKLGELVDEMVFVGGSATGLLITDPGAPPIRVTRDVDAIVQIGSLADYYQLSKKLRARGFKEDASEDAPVCRWVAENIVLDVMPTDTKIFGFGNNWYAPAMEKARLIRLPNRQEIRVVLAPHFLITKLAAFDGRGNGDYVMSHDIEDIIAVLDGRPEIINEIKQSDSGLVDELSGRFKELLSDCRFLDALSGHMPTDETSQARTPLILKTIKEIAEI